MSQPDAAKASSPWYGRELAYAAAQVLGSPAALARYLDVAVEEVFHWLYGRVPTPERSLAKMAALLEQLAPERVPPRA